MQTTYCEGQIHLLLSDVRFYEMKKVTVKVRSNFLSRIYKFKSFSSPNCHSTCYISIFDGPSTPQPKKIPNAARYELEHFPSVTVLAFKVESYKFPLSFQFPQ